MRGRIVVHRADRERGVRAEVLHGHVRRIDAPGDVLIDGEDRADRLELELEARRGDDRRRVVGDREGLKEQPVVSAGRSRLPLGDR